MVIFGVDPDRKPRARNAIEELLNRGEWSTPDRRQEMRVAFGILQGNVRGSEM
jgi:hypothetical protein